MEITQLIAKHLEDTARGPVIHHEMQWSQSRTDMCLNLPFFLSVCHPTNLCSVIQSVEITVYSTHTLAHKVNMCLSSCIPPQHPACPPCTSCESYCTTTMCNRCCATLWDG